MDPHLIVVAYAVAPGPGGPEGHVNSRFLRALGEYWKGGVTVISGGECPVMADGRLLSELPGWTFYALGEFGGDGPRPSVRSRAASWLGHRRRSGRGMEFANRIADRIAYGLTGRGLKATSWQHEGSRVLRSVLRKHPEALVYSRALPFASIGAVAAVRKHRSFLWIVNINDPLPADVWPGLYTVDPTVTERENRVLERTLPLVDAFTFPNTQLRELEAQRFSRMKEVPHLILPHVAESQPWINGKAHEASKSAGDKLRIAFAGTMRKSRVRPELLDGLEVFARRRPDCVKHVVFEFHLARPNPFAQELIGMIPFPTHLSIGKFDDDLDRALSHADILLDLEAEADKPLLLTKISNYIALRKPIWAICMPAGITWNLIEEKRWGYASKLGDAAALAETLEQVYSDWTTGRLSQREPSEELRARFSPERQVDDLRALCAHLTARTEEDKGRMGKQPWNAEWP